MSARKPPQKANSSNTRMMLAGALILIATAIVLALRQPGDDKGSGREATQELASDVGQAASEAAEDGAPERTRSGIREMRVQAAAEVDAALYPAVSRVLSDESLGIEQAAAELLDIVQRADLSEDERLEALSHGLNLDFKAFAAVAADPALPVALAERYFSELCNQNELPEAQIHGCLDLLSHQDEEIRKQAAEQLAFLVEKEELTESPDALRKAAAEHLAKLQNPRPAPVTDDADDGPE